MIVDLDMTDRPSKNCKCLYRNIQDAHKIIMERKFIKFDTSINIGLTNHPSQIIFHTCTMYDYKINRGDIYKHLKIPFHETKKKKSSPKYHAK